MIQGSWTAWIQKLRVIITQKSVYTNISHVCWLSGLSKSKLNVIILSSIILAERTSLLLSTHFNIVLALHITYIPHLDQVLGLCPALWCLSLFFCRLRLESLKLVIFAVCPTMLVSPWLQITVAAARQRMKWFFKIKVLFLQSCECFINIMQQYLFLLFKMQAVTIPGRPWS